MANRTRRHGTRYSLENSDPAVGVKASVLRERARTGEERRTGDERADVDEGRRVEQAVDDCRRGESSASCSAPKEALDEKRERDAPSWNVSSCSCFSMR